MRDVSQLLVTSGWLDDDVDDDDDDNDDNENDDHDDHDDGDNHDDDDDDDNDVLRSCRLPFERYVATLEWSSRNPQP